MSFLNKILGSKKNSKRQELLDSLEGVDFHAAAENLTLTFRQGARNAEAEGKQYCVKNELLASAERFTENPCLKNAVSFLEEYPYFVEVFNLTKDPLQVWARDLKKTKG
jgi:hypothetical protein